MWYNYYSDDIYRILHDSEAVHEPVAMPFIAYELHSHYKIHDDVFHGTI